MAIYRVTIDYTSDGHRYFAEYDLNADDEHGAEVRAIREFAATRSFDSIEDIEIDIEEIPLGI